MNTKPKARKFRIRRAAPLTVLPPVRVVATTAAAGAAQPVPQPRSVAATLLRSTDPIPLRQAVPQAPPRRAEVRPVGEDASLFEPTDDGFGPGRFPTADQHQDRPETIPEKMNHDLMPPDDLGSDAEQDAIRRESLTGRQLRMARRMAQKHGLPATSDFDAVRLLRRAGIDPFQRSNMLELVIPDTDSRGKALLLSDPSANLPQTMRQPLPPSKEVRPDARVQDIMAIQQDLARRRRRKSLLLALRLAFFVGLPTLLAAIYFYAIATPLFSTKSEFVIQKAEGPSAAGMGGLLSGTTFATTTDSITVQSYLESRDAMLRLNEDLGFKAHFSQPGVDVLQRLDPDATNEAAYRLYKRNVKIGFDPTEGIIRMEVIALDPQVSAGFSTALIKYAEEQVDQLTQRVRGDQMKGARDAYDEAEVNMLAAQQKVVELQEKYKILSSEVEVTLMAGQISTLEAQLTQERLKLEELLANANPSAARVDPVRNRIANLEQEVQNVRGRMTESDVEGQSLAQIQSQLLAAQSDVATRQLMLGSSLEAMEVARSEANRQVRYLSIGVNPVAPDEPTYPRAFEDSFMAFMIFAGIYLMMSMTASILREQVSA